MKINFAMWRKASWELIKMDDKKEWEALDVISKWLIATRSAVTTVTLYSAVIAGLLAWRDGVFSWLPWLITALGLFIAHGTNNLLNDYTDYSRGVDKDNYFRTQYGVHPLVQGFWTKSQQIQWFIVSGIIATLSGVYALFYTGFNPTVIGLFVLGALILLFYTWPLKYWALGELAIFLIWGPIMIAGVYLVLSGRWDWNVALAGIPFGLSVASINVSKHIDKMNDDKAKGVGTFPVRVGQTFARHHQYRDVLLYLWCPHLPGHQRLFLHLHSPTLVCAAARVLRCGCAIQTPPRWRAGGFRGFLANLVFRFQLLPQPPVWRPIRTGCLAGRALPPVQLAAPAERTGLDCDWDWPGLCCRALCHGQGQEKMSATE